MQILTDIAAFVSAFKDLMSVVNEEQLLNDELSTAAISLPLRRLWGT